MTQDIGWGCIESYFTESRYPRSHNCIESYDEFLEHGMPDTIAAANPLVLAQDGNRLEVHVSAPTVVLNKAYAGSPEERHMLPNEARMLDKTYGGDIFADFECRHSGPGGAGEYVIERVKLGSIPVMLHSKACALRTMTREQLAAVGECPYDEGGYHVIEGMEKIVTSRDTIAMNKLMVERIGEADPRYAKVRMEGKMFCRARGELYPRKITFAVAPDGSITAVLSVSRSLRMRSELSLPLFTLFRLVGLETDADIMRAIAAFCVGMDEDLVFQMLRTCAVHGRHNGHSHAAAMLYARGSLAVGQPLRVAEVEAVMKASVFPNAQGDVHLHLARVTAELLACVAGKPLPDRDSQYLKRVESPGAKIADMFRDVYSEVVRLTLQSLTREWNDTRAQSVPISKILRQQTAPRIVQSVVLTDLMKRALRGKWMSPSPGSIQQEGVVHTLPRASIHAALAYQNRVTNPAPPSLKRREPRMLRGDQWGYLCAVHTPDGNNVGLVKQLAMFARITPRTVDVTQVLKTVFDSGASKLGTQLSDAQGRTPILVDGTLEGFCEDPRELRQKLIAARRASKLSPWVSVHWIAGVSNAVEINCDGGRLTRPLLIVNPDGTFSTRPGFSELLHPDAAPISESGTEPTSQRGKGQTRDTRSRNTNSTTSKRVGGEGAKSPDFAPMEYVDAQEIDCCRVAIRPEEIVPGMTTHLEMHATTMLSPISLLTPFADHNAAPRNIFSCKQTTACASLYASNFRSRADAVNILHHSQRPLVATRYGTLMGADDMPNGENPIVAIMTYTGSNQEDAVILNASSVQRGMFHTTHVELVTCDEESAEGTLDRFSHPVSAGVVELKAESYHNLDAGGLPMPETEIHAGDAIVGKVRKQGGSGLVVDTSLVAGVTEHGVVDRVALIPLNRGQRRCKIRIRDFRQPTVGDKFASRHGQKGVVGRLLAQEDMPFTDGGLVPDIIINPHAFPSRMTCGHLLEALCCKATAMDGVATDSTPFMRHDLASVSERLSKFGDAMGDDLMSSGTQGVQHSMGTCLAPTYYMRLKQQVIDKVAATRVARKTSITRQPAQGRANGGGMRLGEMERDSVMGNGLSQFVKETLVERSDKPPRPTRLVDGVPTAMNRTHGTWDRTDESAATTDVFSAEIPTAMTALMSELGAMCIDTKLSGTRS